jgi:hypothetical protein
MESDQANKSPNLMNLKTAFPLENYPKNAALGVAQYLKFTYSSPQRPDTYISISLDEVGVTRCGPN